MFREGGTWTAMQGVGAHLCRGALAVHLEGLLKLLLAVLLQLGQLRGTTQCSGCGHIRALQVEACTCNGPTRLTAGGLQSSCGVPARAFTLDDVR
jgi:hypothetical protein